MGTLETSYGNFSIYLNRLHGNLFHISFVDKQNKTQFFLMRYQNDKWIFEGMNNLPDWISRMQDQLDTLIKRQLLKDQSAVIS